MPILETLLKKMRGQTVAQDPTINAFWRAQLDPMHRILSAGGTEDITALTDALRYAPKMLPSGMGNLSFGPTNLAVAFLEEQLPRAIAQFNKQLPASKDKSEIEHLTMLYVLQQGNLISEYIAFLDEMQIASEMSMARHFFYFKKVESFFKDADLKGPIKIVEIGAGAGVLASFLIRRLEVAEYHIVDLPEMLLNSAANLARFNPSAKFTLNGVAESHDGEGPALHFYEPENVGLIPNRSGDILLNFNSFMEMRRDVRDGYIDQVYRIGRSRALFYNVNRRQKAMADKDGASHDNHPLLYPYRSSDIVLEWEPDFAQQSYRSRFSKTPQDSFAISRAALINP